MDQVEIQLLLPFEGYDKAVDKAFIEPCGNSDRQHQPDSDQKPSVQGSDPYHSGPGSRQGGDRRGGTGGCVEGWVR